MGTDKHIFNKESFREIKYREKYYSATTVSLIFFNPNPTGFHIFSIISSYMIIIITATASIALWFIYLCFFTVVIAVEGIPVSRIGGGGLQGYLRNSAVGIYFS